MGYLIVSVCVLLAVFAFKIERKWYNPATVTLSVWAIVLLLYELKLFGIYNVSAFTYYTIAIGLFFFFVGYLISASGKRRIVFQRIGNYSLEDEYINYRLLKICGIVVFLFFAEEAIETLVLVRAGVSLFDIRTSLQGYAEYGFSDNLYSLRNKIGTLYSWTIFPIYNSLLILTCIDIFSKKKIKCC